MLAHTDTCTSQMGIRRGHVTRDRGAAHIRGTTHRVLRRDLDALDDLSYERDNLPIWQNGERGNDIGDMPETRVERLQNGRRHAFELAFHCGWHQLTDSMLRHACALSRSCATIELVQKHTAQST